MTTLQSARPPGVDVSDKELQSFINHIDVDRDGVISFDEWLDFLLLLPRKTTIVNVYHYYQHMFHVGDFSEAALISEEGSHRSGAGSMHDTNHLTHSAICQAFIPPLNILLLAASLVR